MYCREKKMRDFTSERGDANVSDVFARPGSRYLVIDIGGNNNMKSNSFRMAGDAVPNFEKIPLPRKGFYVVPAGPKLFPIKLCSYDKRAAKIYRFSFNSCFPFSKGGTLDVTAHEILGNGNIKEIHQVTGGPYGGTKVDEEFVSLLERFFGTALVRTFRTNNPAEWLEMMNEFEMKKRGRRAFEGETTRIRVPRAFATLVSEYREPDLARRFASSCTTDEVQFIRNEYFCLGPAAMRKLFQPVLNGIVSHLHNLLKHPVLKRLQFFFLVGGFAESEILQEAIKKNFSTR